MPRLQNIARTLRCGGFPVKVIRSREPDVTDDEIEILGTSLSVQVGERYIHLVINEGGDAFRFMDVSVKDIVGAVRSNLYARQGGFSGADARFLRSMNIDPN